MSIEIYSTLTRAKSPLAPIEAGHVRMYVCGITVYDLCHIGHARANIAFDDHPGELRWSNRIRTVTVESVFKFVERIDPESRRIEVR